LIVNYEVEGCWSLVTWVQRYDDGRVVEPYGPRPAGTLVYTGGKMFCLMSRADREPFRTGGQWTADPAEKARAYDEVTAYSGTYELVGDEVVHHVAQALFPNWAGGSQRRRIVECGAVLRLTARLEEGTSEARTAELSWVRG
jgi:hypothetical protein